MREILDAFEARLDALNTAYGEAQWRKYLARATAGEIDALEAERSALLLDEALFAFVQERSHRAEADHDPMLARRLTLLHRALLEGRVSAPREIYELRTRIDRHTIAFKPIVAEQALSRAGQREMLRKDPDRAHRKAAWLAFGPLAATVEKDVLELMRRRNRIAQSLGYDDYPALALALVGLDRPTVDDLFAEIARATEAPYRAFLSQAAAALRAAQLCPWDLAFAVERLAALPDAAFPKHDLVAVSVALAEGLGLAHAARAVRLDFVDIPYAGLCFGIHPPDDVRILANPRDGHADYAMMFHEFGHALHARHLDTPSPILRDEPGPFNESQACTLQRFAADPDWLVTRPGLDEAAISAYRRGWSQTMLVRLRTLIAQATFEYAAYTVLARPTLHPKSGEPDLAPLYRQTMERYSLISWATFPGWADNPFWTSYPIYLQNYVVAEAVASQTHAELRRLFPALVGQPAVGTWLAEQYWLPAATIEWIDKVEYATGGRLSAQALIADLQSSDWYSVTGNRVY